jgi:predicted nucleic acid-binding protein
VSVLVDTSIWVDFLKVGMAGPGAGVAALLRDREVMACGQVVAELLAGTKPAQRDPLWALLSGLPWLELRPRGWRRVGELAGDARACGHTLPMTDVQIAVLALENQTRLWSRDLHFRVLATLAPELALYEPGGAGL